MSPCCIAKLSSYRHSQLAMAENQYLPNPMTIELASRRDGLAECPPVPGAFATSLGMFLLYRQA